MKSFKLDYNGDLIIENNNLIFIEGTEEKAQSIFITLSTNINEWYLNMNYGLDYSKLQGKDRMKNEIKIALEDAIYQVDGIDKVFIKDINLDKLNRHLKIHGYVTDKDNNNIDLKKIGVISID